MIRLRTSNAIISRFCTHISDLGRKRGKRFGVFFGKGWISWELLDKSLLDLYQCSKRLLPIPVRKLVKYLGSGRTYPTAG